MFAWVRQWIVAAGLDLAAISGTVAVTVAIIIYVLSLTSPRFQRFGDGMRPLVIAFLLCVAASVLTQDTLRGAPPYAPWPEIQSA